MGNKELHVLTRYEVAGKHIYKHILLYCFQDNMNLFNINDILMYKSLRALLCVVCYRCSWCSGSGCSSSHPSEGRSHHGLSHHRLPHHGLHHGSSRPSCSRLVTQGQQSRLGFLKATVCRLISIHH